jgi:hypothetical protein
LLRFSDRNQDSCETEHDASLVVETVEVPELQFQLCLDPRGDEL